MGNLTGKSLIAGLHAALPVLVMLPGNSSRPDPQPAPKHAGRAFFRIFSSPGWNELCTLVLWMNCQPKVLELHHQMAPEVTTEKRALQRAPKSLPRSQCGQRMSVLANLHSHNGRAFRLFRCTSCEATSWIRER
jgi:hypothetical protein